MAFIEILSLFPLYFSLTQWASLIIASILILLIRRTFYWKVRGFHGPTSLFPFDDAYNQLTKPLCSLQMNTYVKYGPIWGGYQGFEPVLFVADPKIIKNIFVKDFQDFPETMNPKTTTSQIEQKFITILDGDDWKRVRSAMTRSFTSGKLKIMFNLVKLSVKNTHQQFFAISQESKRFDPKNFWSEGSLNVIAKSFFATDIVASGESKSNLLRNFTEAFQLPFLRTLLVLTLPKMIARLFKLTFIRRTHLDFFEALVDQIIKNRKQDSHNEAQDFLHNMLENELELDSLVEEVNQERHTMDPSSKKLSKIEIVASSVIFLLAGTEVTSNLLTWLTYRLAVNPDVQNRLYKEISENDIDDYNILINLPYLDAVVKECLRIDPPALILSRRSRNRYHVTDTQTIDPGTGIMIPIYGMHHDPKFYPDPDKFLPDRFLPENAEHLIPFTFLPFGAGPRVCVGMRFALMHTKYAVASVVKKYILTKCDKTPDKPEYSPGVFALKHEGLEVGIKLRET
ncbi:cytochrome P450 3A24-like [Brevipalpus obovatus]|uniref:cytochrome P450 3A24-like n=1 Tax=Brevipalpus obovatus TaxID=246614 RepID=UPI003D9E603B